MKLLDISSNCYAHLVDSTIYLYVNKNNTSAIKAYQNNGFKIVELKDDFIKMITTV